MKVVKFFFFILLLGPLAFNFGRYVPPYPGTYDIGPPPRSNVKRVPFLYSNLSPSAPRFSPATGPKNHKGVQRVLVILAEFQDVKHKSSHTREYFQKLIFDKTASENLMYKYFYEVSYGALQIDDGDGNPDYLLSSPNPIGTNPTDWVTTSYNMSDIGAPTAGDADNYFLMDDFVANAISAASSQIDFSYFDTDNDGKIDHLIIVHAGSDEALSGNAYDIWSQHVGLSDIYAGNGKYADFAVIVSEDDLGVICHEFGHDLGLVDLYDVSNGASVVGVWSLMDIGVWNGSPAGSSPAHMDAWSKSYLGYVEVYKATENIINVALPYVENVTADTTRLVYRVDINDTEYFLIENRRKKGYDAYLPYEGMSIWHIYERYFNIKDNEVNHVEPRGIDMVSSDGSGYGTDGSNPVPFPGITGKEKYSFTPFTSPGSISYDSDEGVKSNVYIKNISEVADTMYFDLIIYPAFLSVTLDDTRAIVKVKSEYEPDTVYVVINNDTVVDLKAGEHGVITKPERADTYAFDVTEDSAIYQIFVYVMNDVLVDSLVVYKFSSGDNSVEYEFDYNQKLVFLTDESLTQELVVKIYPADITSTVFYDSRLYSDVMYPIQIDFESSDILPDFELRFYYNKSANVNFDFDYLTIYKIEKNKLYPIDDTMHNETLQYVSIKNVKAGIYALGIAYPSDKTSFLQDFKEQDAYTYPNPINFSTSTSGRLYFRYILPDAGKIDIKIFDISGRMIKNLYEAREKKKGKHQGEEYWDGRDEFGQRVPPGIYIGVLRFTPNTYDNNLYYKYFKIVVTSK